MEDAHGERMVEYERDDWSQLQLAYAITSHRAQGSEWDNVVVVVSHSHSLMLQRSLLYTAVTRAKKWAVIIYMAVCRTSRPDTSSGPRWRLLQEMNALPTATADWLNGSSMQTRPPHRNKLSHITHPRSPVGIALVFRRHPDKCRGKQKCSHKQNQWRSTSQCCWKGSTQQSCETKYGHAF
jgi:hypothetical protein